MNRIKKLFCLVLGCTFMFLSMDVFALTSTKITYEYPITPNDVEWLEFTSLEEKIDACQIPEDILYTISTDELINVVLDYPLIVNAFLFNSISDGIDSVSSYFNGIQELQTRTDGAEKLLSKFKEKSVITNLRNHTDYKNIKNITLLEGLLTKDIFLNKLNEIEKNEFYTEVEQKYNEKLKNPAIYSYISPLYEKLMKEQNISTYDSPTYIYTPKGTRVDAIMFTELPADVIAYYNQDTDRAYPRATRLRSATRKYNCHSYAWYTQSGTNMVWLNNYNSFISDGSYFNSFGYPPQVNDIVETSNKTHSSLITTPNNTSGKHILTSKWGEYGLYRHGMDDSPYSHNGSNNYYRRNY